MLHPEIIKGIWNSGIYNPKVNSININVETPDSHDVVMHEVFTILNLNLNKRNLQIPSYLDTVILEPVNGNKKQKKIKVIDYKTGNKDFSDITFLDKLQALLMLASAFYSFIDKTITEGISDWDATHDIKYKDLPHLEKRAMLGPHRYNKSITDYELLYHLENISNSVRFILCNPVTNQSVEINYAPIAKKGIDYLTDLNEFYYQNKEKLKPSKLKLFDTPKFVPEKILYPEKYNQNYSYRATQPALQNLF